MVGTSVNITVMVLPHTVKSPGMYRNIVTNYYNKVGKTLRNTFGEIVKVAALPCRNTNFTFPCGI